MEAKPSHLGTILIVLGLVLLLVVIGLGGFLLIQGASRTFATIDSEGEHTFELPSAGEFVLARHDSLDPGIETLWVESAGPDIEFTDQRENMYIVIGDDRFKVLGTLNAARAGQHTITVAADAYPLTIRHEPMAMARRVMTIFGVLVAIPILTTIIGVVLAVRNTNKRNRMLMDEMT